LKVLITGGAGFIGSHLADRILARGDEVVVIDNFATARRDSLPGRPRLTVEEGTIADAATVSRLVEGMRPDVLVHAAASYKDPDNWFEDALTNAVGSANVVKAAKAAGTKRIIYFQTALCYGVRPLEQPITLEHPLRPGDSSYAISKTAGEYYVRLSGIDHVSLRLANVYGPRNLSGPLPTFYQRLTTGKPCFVMETRRDFVFVDDLVDVAVMAIDGRGEGVYHVSSGSDVAIKELFGATLKALGMRADVEVRPRNPDDAPSILLDPSRTIRDFSAWKPRVSLDTGVRKAIDWYREHGVGQTFTHLRPTEPASIAGR
jgi:UDP-glucose 4-epimerase